MKREYVCLSVLVAAVCLTVGCRKNLFDANLYEAALSATFHNDVVDPKHKWSLTSDWLVSVTANVAGVSRIEVLSGNPFEQADVEVLATYADVRENDVVQLCYSTPVTSTTVYVAAVTKDEQYTLAPLTVGDNTVNFSHSIDTSGQKMKMQPAQQEIYYCYCNSYPQPSVTWGFNDLVMRISKDIVSQRTLRLNVTLVALGSNIQMAGALRLGGVMFDAVEKVAISSASSFVKNEESARTIIREKDLLLKGLDGTAVLNMFDDAHLALYSRIDGAGNVSRYYFNVSRNTDQTHLMFTPVTVSYDITFKADGMANTMGYETLDPFIAYYYNGNIWEIHKYAFKLSEALFDYYDNNEQIYNNGFTWALEIPYTFYRYPLLGNAVGSYKNGALFGAYQRLNHSFGEWGADQTIARDWYLYPITSMVY